jgi:hypothetical protein
MHYDLQVFEIKRWIKLKAKELKNLTDVVYEPALSRAEMIRLTQVSMTEFTGQLKSTEKLWKKSGNSILVKAGLALIAFSDPTISDILGSGLVAAGLIQMKMKNSALYVEDVYKTFPNVLRELASLTELRLSSKFYNVLANIICA